MAGVSRRVFDESISRRYHRPPKLVNSVVLGQHHVVAKNFLYEELIHVPLIIRGPGFPAGVHVTAPVANVDLAATVLKSTGVKPPPGHVLDGRSLKALARNTQAGKRRAVLLESTKLPRPGTTGVRTARYVLVEHAYASDAPEYELYDLDPGKDPYQIQSVHDDPGYAVVRARLLALLQRLRSCVGPACRAIFSDPL